MIWPRYASVFGTRSRRAKMVKRVLLPAAALYAYGTFCQVQIQMALRRAVEAGDYEQTRRLLSAGGDPNDWTIRLYCGRIPLPTEKETDDWRNGTPLLMTAARNGHDEIVNLLLEYGARVNARNEWGVTTLSMAADFHARKVVEILLSHGAEVNIADLDHHTALIHTAFRGDAGLIGRLLAAGANIHHVDDQGHSVLIYALDGGQFDCIKAIVEAGVDVNRPTRGGDTPLMIAARRRDFRTVSLLLAHRANVHARNKKGETVADIARQNGQKRLGDLLDGKK